MSEDLPSFNKNYETLKNIAEKIKNEGNKEIPDIDNLLPMVEAATAAYKACKIRLDAVEQALSELDTNATPTTESSSTDNVPF